MLRQFFIRCIDTVMVLLLVAREEISGERAPATVTEDTDDPPAPEPSTRPEGSRAARSASFAKATGCKSLVDLLAAHFAHVPTEEVLTERGARARFELRALCVQRLIADLLEVHPCALDLRWDTDRDGDAVSPRVCDVKIQGARISPAAWLLLQENDAPIWPYVQAQAAWQAC